MRFRNTVIVASLGLFALVVYLLFLFIPTSIDFKEQVVIRIKRLDSQQFSFKICSDMKRENECKPIALLGFNVVECENQKPVWGITSDLKTRKGELNNIIYGQIPNGFTENAKPTVLEKGKCYVATVIGITGSTTFKFTAP